VLDESRQRTRRLAVLNELTSRSRVVKIMPHDANCAGKTERGRGAKAAWFQLMEGEHLVPRSTSTLAGIAPGSGHAGTSATQAKVLHDNRAAVVKLSQMSDLERVRLGSAAFVTLYWCRCGAKIGDRDAFARLFW